MREIKRGVSTLRKPLLSRCHLLLKQIDFVTDRIHDPLAELKI